MSEYFDGPWYRRERNEENFSTFRRIFTEPICLFDLGAAGGTPPPFLFLGDAVDVVNFEPDKDAVVSNGRRNFPIAIGPSELNQIFLNRRPTTSSLLQPNSEITNRYDWAQLFGTEGDIFETVRVEPIETRPLDALAVDEDLPQPDFLKIDVQGLSLEVLQGGTNLINESVLGMDIEVEFFECYRSQRTMGAVHEWLLEQGFEIFRLKNLNNWYYKTKLALAHYSGQHTFCDLVYFRAIDSIGRTGDTFWTPGRASRMLQLLLLYDLTDAAAAYYERFRDCDLIPPDSAKPIERLICQWEKALDYFYEPSPRKRKSRMKRFLDISPLDVLRKIRDAVRR